MRNKVVTLSIIKLFMILVFLQSSPVGACIFNCPGIYKTTDGDFALKGGMKSGFQFHVNYFDQKKHNFNYIKDETRARSGNYFQQFELRDGDCFSDGMWNDCETDRERIEFSSRPRQILSYKQCYGYSLKLSKDFRDISPTNITLGQIHQKGGPKGEAGGFKSFPNLIHITVKGNALYFGWDALTGSRTNVTSRLRLFRLKWLDEMLDVWTDISFCLDFKESKIEVWVDGKQKVKLLKSPINPKLKPQKIYFKYGIYRSFVSRYKDIHKTLPTQIVYFDEIRRGNSVEDVDVNFNPELKPVD